MKTVINTNSRSNNQIKKFVDRGLTESQAWIYSSTYYSSDLLLKVLLDTALAKTSVEDLCTNKVDCPSPDRVMIEDN